MSYQLPLDFVPDLPGLVAADRDFFPALLASEASHSATGRYSMVFADVIDQQLATRPEHMPEWFRSLDADMAIVPDASKNQSVLPFEHGWFFYLSYEAVAGWEPRLASMRQPPGEPLALALKCAGAVVLDHATGKVWVTAQDKPSAQRIYQKVLTKGSERNHPWPQYVVTVEPPEYFKKQVQRVREYIAAGDVYQVNLARQWHLQAPFWPTPVQCYRHLARCNPAPFSGVLDWHDFAIISSSPERLVSRRGDLVETRPIAGTRPRGANAEIDSRLMGELIAHPKERAEHIMLLDLERNDLGRICQPGSVRVSELMVVESYAHVHHIVSNVQGRVRPNTAFSDVIKAVFPGGTITGCPKIRCMEIIHELEQRPRGGYTGTMGYLNHNGDMDSNILIRTLIKQGKQMNFMAGAGIVMDSVPSREVEETGHKAKGLLRALGVDATAPGTETGYELPATD